VKAPSTRTHYIESYDEKKGHVTFVKNDGSRRVLVKLPKFMIELLQAEYNRGQNDALVKVRKALGV